MNKYEDLFNIHKFTHGKHVIKNRLLFSNGQPLFRWTPNIFRWGNCISCFWLGTELVFVMKGGKS